MTLQLALDDLADEYDDSDLSVLTDAERTAYEKGILGDRGVREFARQTDRKSGTIDNQLRRARRRLDGDEVADTW